MISDILSEASAEIRRYQTEQPSVYRRWQQRLDALTTEMDALRAELDTPPGNEETRQSVYEATYAATHEIIPRYDTKR